MSEADIIYNKRVLNNLERIMGDCRLQKIYDIFEQKLMKDPFTVQYPVEEMPKNVQVPIDIFERLHFVRIADKIQILYYVNERDNEISILMIEFEDEE